MLLLISSERPAWGLHPERELRDRLHPLHLWCLAFSRRARASSALGPPLVTIASPLPCFEILFSSVAQLCPTLCDLVDRSTPGFPALHYLPEFAQTQVHWVSDAIQPSYSVAIFSSCLSLPQHQVFPVSRLFASGGQSIGASASVLQMNMQGWFPLGLTGLISLLSIDPDEAGRGSLTSEGRDPPIRTLARSSLGFGGVSRWSGRVFLDYLCSEQSWAQARTPQGMEGVTSHDGYCFGATGRQTSWWVLQVSYLHTIGALQSGT